MKKILLFILVLSIGRAFAQQNNDNNYNRPDNNGNSRISSRPGANRPNTYNNARIPNNGNRMTDEDGYSQVRIIDSTQQIRADVLPFKTEPKIKNDRYYYWYLENVIHSTQGGYNGQLLNGHYVAFYPDKNLKEEGDFKRGLKDGEWKTWNRKGDLTSVTLWNEGILVPDGQQPFWKKIPFFNKKDNQSQNPNNGGGN